MGKRMSIGAQPATPEKKKAGPEREPLSGGLVVVVVLLIIVATFSATKALRTPKPGTTLTPAEVEKVKAETYQPKYGPGSARGGAPAGQPRGD